MNKKVKLINLFKNLLNHKSDDFIFAINFKRISKKTGEHFEKSNFIQNMYKIKYIYQPNGSQQYPDFILKEYKIAINIECKTSKNKKIVWNSGFPHSNVIVIYAYSKEKEKDITYFLVNDKVENGTEEKVKEWENKQKDIVSKAFSTEFNLPDWTFYLRAMYNDKMNYISNPKRREWEKNVINFLRKSI